MGTESKAAHASSDIEYRGYRYTGVVPLGTVDFHGSMNRFDARFTILPDDEQFECFAANGAGGRFCVVRDKRSGRCYEVPWASIASYEIRG